MELGRDEAVWTEMVQIWVLGTLPEEVGEIRAQTQEVGEGVGGHVSRGRLWPVRCHCEVTKEKWTLICVWRPPLTLQGLGAKGLDRQGPGVPCGIFLGCRGAQEQDLIEPRGR